MGFEYDDAGRVTKQILPDLREIALAYDADGNLTSVTPPSRPEHAYEYNRVNLATDYVPPALADAGRTEYIYSVDRELEQIVRPDGSAIDLDYDSGGRLQSLAASGIARSFGYDAAGNLSSIAGASSSISYQYDGSTPTQMSVKFVFIRGQVSGWGMMTVGTAGKGITGEPQFNYAVVTTRELQRDGRHETAMTLSQLPKVIEKYLK
ncbi:MAG: hypothetical protein M3P06_11265 [Acidobacteriota bacterium]|nr:hypothetical protein [Acidobacteriota bacterium]